nr:P1-P2 fusion protein [cacao polerovirus]
MAISQIKCDLKSILLSLLWLSSLSFCTPTSTSSGTTFSKYPAPLRKNFSEPASSFNISLLYDKEIYCSGFISEDFAKPRELATKVSFRNLWWALMFKGRSSMGDISNGVWRFSRTSFTSTCATLKQQSSNCLERILWMFAWIWWTILINFFSGIVWVLTTYTMPCLAIILCAGLTWSLVWTLRKILSNLPVCVPWWLLKTCISLPLRIFSRSRRFVAGKVIREKSVDGFLSFEIDQKPPKNSVLEIDYVNFEFGHVGYATCIKLFNGKNGLLTCAHCLDEHYAVRSTVTGNKIKMVEFREIYVSEKLDLAILEGPPNWEGILGCKGVNYTTMSHVDPCKAMIYHLTRDGKWKASGAQVDKRFNHWVTVLSDTAAGFSGTPYFNGKTVVGVHVGHKGDEFNFNLMSTIPPIPGLTAPNYFVETTQVKGKLFTDEEIADLLEDFTLAEVRSMVQRTSIKADRIIERKESPVPLKGVLMKKKGAGSSGSRRRRAIRQQLREERTERPPTPPVPSAPEQAAPPTMYPIVDSSPVHVEKLTEEAPRRQGKRGSGGDRRNNRPPGLKHPFRRYYKPTDKGPRRESEYVGNTGSSGERGHQEPEGDPPQKRVARSWEEEANNFRSFFQQIYSWEVPSATKAVPGFRHCGSIPQYYHPTARKESKWGQDLLRRYPELAEKTAGFGWPQAGAKAEMRSLLLQAERWRQRAASSSVPSAENRKRVIDRTVSEYSKVKTAAPRATRSGSLSYEGFKEDFLEAVQSLELDAGVGIPLIAYGIPTHRGWVEDQFLLNVLAQSTFARLQKLAEADFETLLPEDLIKKGLCDPIRVFVKGEPHKQAKLDEGRYRLIMSVSLVDQLVARVLFQNQNKRELALWRAIPSKPGFGLSTDGQVRDFTYHLEEVVGRKDCVVNWQDCIVPTDCSGFDWSVADWMLEDEMEVRNQLTYDNNQLTRRLRESWLKCLSNSVLALSDGTLLAQTAPGVQKSGSYNTSSSNSRIRVMAAYHAGASWAMAMGDDALESPDVDLNVYKQIGFKVEVSRDLEFCSHLFVTRDLAIPVNENKMLYKLVFGYDPGCGNLEVVNNYMMAVVSILQELRHNAELVAKLILWLLPEETQKNIGRG